MSTEKELGRLEARMDAMEADMTEIKRDVRQIRDAAISVKGGWKTIVLFASVSAAVGAIGAKVAPFFGFIPK